MSRELLRCEVNLKEYPPRFKFEIFENTSNKEYFKIRRVLTYTMIGAKIGDQSDISDIISVPPHSGA